MPAYDFLCETCRVIVEDYVPRTTKSVPCPQCGGKTKRQFPAPALVGTNTAFLKGSKKIGDQFGHDFVGKAHLQQRLALLKRKGFTPSANDVYLPQLAMSPDDPAGYVPHDDPVGHIKRVMAQRGQADLSGNMGDFTPLYNEKPRAHRLHPKIVREIAEQRIRNNPSEAKRDRRELHEEISQRHGSD